MVNYGFAYTDAQSNLYMHPTWMLDWMTPHAAIVAIDSLQVGIEGDFWDSAYGEEYPADTIPVMPYKIASSPAGFQAFISDFTIDSFFNSVIEEAGAISFWFLATEVPPTASWQMTTGFLNKFLPGLSSTFGPDQPCDVLFSIESLNNFVSSEIDQNVSLQGDLNLQVWVHAIDGTYVKAVELLLSSVLYKGTLMVENEYDLSMQIQTVNVDKITVVYSGIGFISALVLKTEINNGFRLFMPIINSKLALHNMTVPHNIFGVFTLSDLSIGYFDQYIFFGMTPTFLPPVVVSSLYIEEQLSDIFPIF